MSEKNGSPHQAVVQSDILSLKQQQDRLDKLSIELRNSVNETKVEIERLNRRLGQLEARRTANPALIGAKAIIIAAQSRIIEQLGYGLKDEDEYYPCDLIDVEDNVMEGEVPTEVFDTWLNHYQRFWDRKVMRRLSSALAELPGSHLDFGRSQDKVASYCQKLSPLYVEKVLAKLELLSGEGVRGLNQAEVDAVLKLHNVTSDHYFVMVENDCVHKDNPR